MAKKKEEAPVEVNVTEVAPEEVAPESTEEVVAEIAPTDVAVEEVAPVEPEAAETPKPVTSYKGKDFQLAADGNPYIPPGLEGKI